MPRIEKLKPPDHALHRRYEAEQAYLDGYSTIVDGRVALAPFVEAFYTTWLFKLERWILAWTVRKRSHDAEARWLAHGDVSAFAAWTVEARTSDQLLMRDFLGATRSWFMVSPEPEGRTRLWFGSAVLPEVDSMTSHRALGRNYRLLMGFHRVYSRALLRAAAVSLSRTG